MNKHQKTEAQGHQFEKNRGPKIWVKTNEIIIFYLDKYSTKGGWNSFH
jgi:hypothetical protein